MTIVRARTDPGPRPEPAFRAGPPANSWPLLAGSLAVALLLFGTRWGSYLGIGGVLLLSDVLMAGGVLLTVIRSARGVSTLPPGASRGVVPWPILLLGAYAVVRFAVGGTTAFVAIRDAAPYVYVLLGLLGFYIVRRSTPAQRDRTARLLVVALTGHAVWYALVLAMPDLPASLPLLSTTQDLHVLTPRQDVDCALIGVLAAYVLWRALRFRRSVPVLLIAYVALWVLIGLSTSRGGLLGAATANAFVLLLVLSDRRRAPLDRIAVAFVVVVAALVGAGLVLGSDVGSKFIATLNPAAPDTSADGEGTIAEGTTRARSHAWDRLVQWTFEDTGRATFGVGFGPDFLSDSGATSLLVGTALEEDVTPRSPHNYWLGSLGRLGVVGLALLAVAIALVLVRAWRARSVVRDDRFALLTAAIVYALILPATVGVVLESPFGYVPFWWCAGCVLGLATTAGARTLAEHPARRSLARRHP